MKTQGMKSFSARRLGAVATIAFALVATSITTGFAADPSFGKACTTEGVSTGTSSSSLVCTMGDNGKLTWTNVRLGQSTGAPVAALKASPGTIEFHHFRPEDKAVFASIIAKFEAAMKNVARLIAQMTANVKMENKKIKAENEALLAAIPTDGKQPELKPYVPLPNIFDISFKIFVTKTDEGRKHWRKPESLRMGDLFGRFDAFENLALSN